MQTAYGMTRQEYLAANNGTPLKSPVVLKNQNKDHTHGMDTIRWNTYDPIGVSEGRPLAFGCKTDSVTSTAWATFGDNPLYQDFGIFYAREHHPNTARFGATVGGVTYPHLDNLWWFDAITPINIFAVMPPNASLQAGGTNPPTFYSTAHGWTPVANLQVFQTETVGGVLTNVLKTCKVMKKSFLPGRINLPSQETVLPPNNVAPFRGNPSGRMISFMVSIDDGSQYGIPYAPPHPALIPGAERPQEVLDIFNAPNPHFDVIDSVTGERRNANCFVPHPLIDGFGMNWKHLHTLLQLPYDVHLDLLPTEIQHIPVQQRKFYPIAKVYDPINGQTRHSDLWIINYKVFRNDTNEPFDLTIMTELGSYPSPDAITRTRRETRIIVRQNGVLLGDWQFLRSAGVKRVMAASKALQGMSNVPSWVVAGQVYRIYTPLDINNIAKNPDGTFIRDTAEDGVAMTTLGHPTNSTYRDGGYNNYGVSVPQGMGIIGAAQQVNVPGKVRQFNSLTGQFAIVDGVQCWVLSENPDEWFYALPENRGSRRWSNLNPVSGSGNTSWQFSFASLKQNMLAQSYKGATTMAELDTILEADGYWFYTTPLGNVFADGSLPYHRRQYMNPDCELTVKAVTTPGGTTSNSRFLVTQLIDHANDDSYQQEAAGVGEPDHVDRAGHDAVLAPGN